MSVGRRFASCLVCVIALAGCHRLRHRHATTSSAPRWVLDPAALDLPAATLSIDEGATLSLGFDGERWLTNASGAITEVAGDLREPLVAARKGGGSFEFAGESGVLWTSRTPTGTLSRAGAAPAGARSIALGDASILVVDRAGALLRSIDDGKTFAKVELPAHGAFRAVAMSGAVGIALGVPMFAFYTRTDGASWAPVTLPPNARGRARAEGGAIVLDGDDARLRFDPVKAAFDELPAAPRDKREVTARLAGDGAHVARLVATQDATGFHDVRIEVLGPTRRPPRALWDSCQMTDVAVRGSTIVATCDSEDGDRLSRSDDDGATFHDVATSTRGTPRSLAALAIGDGFVYYGARCGAECSPPRVLDAAGHWRDVPEAGDPLAFARDGADLYHLSGDLLVYRWRNGAPETFAKLPKEPHVSRATLGAAGGVVRAALQAPTWRAYDVKKDDAKPVALPPDLLSLAFAGKKGLARDERGLIETLDGTTWRRVDGPKVRDIEACSAAGCATDRGARVGWSSGTGPLVTAPHKAFAPPLRCKPAGDWVELGGSQRSPDADAVDHVDARWVAGLRDARGAVTVLRASWNGPIEKLDLMGPAPAGEDDRSLTNVFVQPAGVVARRFRYKRGLPGGNRNPVTLDASWIRDAGGRFESAPRAIGTFFVGGHDPQAPPAAPDDATTESGPYVTWLGARGLWVRAAQTGLWHLRDDGASQTYFAPAFDMGGVATAVLENEEPLMLGFDRSNVTLAAPRADQAVTVAPFFGAQGAMDARGDRLLATVDGHTFSFAVSATGAISGATELATVDARTPPCPSGPGEGALTLPWTRGERRFLTIEGDSPTVLATARVRARVASGKACVVAWEAESAEPTETVVVSALLFAGALDRSVELRRDRNAWPSQLSMRPLSCAPAELPFPKELESTPGFDDR